MISVKAAIGILVASFFVSSVPLFSQVAFDPNFEGTYRIKIDCPEFPPSEACAHVNAIQKMAIVNIGATLQPSGLVVIDIIADYAHIPYYDIRVKNIEDGGTTLIGISDPNEPVSHAEIRLSIDPVTKAVSGIMRDASIPVDLTLTGTQETSPGSLYSDVSVPLNPSDLAGYHHVNAATMQGTLVLREPLTTLPSSYADFVVDGAIIAVFDKEEFLPDKGVLNLISSEDRIKWTLAVRKGADGHVSASGLGIPAAHGETYPVSF